MKRILELIALLAAVLAIGSMTTGCEDESQEGDGTGMAEILEQVSVERGLRLGAEALADQATGKQAYLRGIALLLFLTTIAAFVGGTTLGSRARKDAERQ